MSTPPWFEAEVLEAAARMLGWRVVSDIGGIRVIVELNEVEAYAGETDPASHAFRGRTPRNGSMFGPPGTLYVYRSYGIHWCMNVVVGPAGLARAVLLRGGRVTEGAAEVRVRRRRDDHLADGPGKLTQALGVTGDYDGHHMSEAPLRLLAPAGAPGNVITTPRIGISRATKRPWRYVATPVSGEN